MTKLAAPENGVVVKEFRVKRNGWTLYRLMYSKSKYANTELKFFKLQVSAPAPRRKRGQWRTYWFSAGPTGIRRNSDTKALSEQRPELADAVLPWLTATLAVNSGD